MSFAAIHYQPIFKQQVMHDGLATVGIAVDQQIDLALVS
jgi:hypothetical protein